MSKKKIFISFDYENDKNIKGSLKSQLESDVVSVAVSDRSINKAIDEKWKDEARRRISGCNFVIFLCGKKTSEAAGVSAEMSIVKELKKPYFLLCGRRKGKVKKPSGSLKTDKVYKWTPDNLKLLLNSKKNEAIEINDNKIDDKYW